MTEPPDDGVDPSLTRSERRAQRSRRARRRAARLARQERRRARAAPPGRGTAGGSEPEDVDTAPTPLGRDVEADTVPAGPTRRERRTGGRAARRVAAAAASATAAEVGAPPAEPPRSETVAATAVESAPAAGPPEAEPDALPAPSPPEPPPTHGPEAVPTGTSRRRSRAARRSKRAPSSALAAAGVDAHPEVAVGRSARRRGATRPKATPAVSTRTLWRVVVPLIVLGLVVAVLVGDRLRSDATVHRRSAGRELAAEAATEPTLLVHRGPLGNDLVAVTGRDGSGGGVLMVPPNLRVDVLGEGVANLRGVSVDDGGRQLTTVVENILGIRIARTVVLDDPGLTAALAPAAPIPVDLPGDVSFSDRPARYRAGQQGLSAAQAAEVLTAPQRGSELDQLVDAGAVFTGWLDRLRDRGIARRTLAVTPGLGALVRAASAPDRRVDTLPVDSLGIGGAERYVAKPVESAALLKRMFPSAGTETGRGRARTEIYNGVGALGVAEAVAEKVVPAGARVVRTDNVAGFGVTQTQVVYYRDAWRPTAQAMLDAMGCGSLRMARPDQDLGIADVTIIVGSDCPAYATPGGAR